MPLNVHRLISLGKRLLGLLGCSVKYGSVEPEAYIAVLNGP